jgi:uncharacterized protein YdaU (DUF1376 family)
MAKDPAFLFYPNDYIGGTLGMTFEDKGAYIELLMVQFNRGHMTSDMIGQTIGQLWDKVKDKFEEDEDGKFFNKRLEEEQIKRKRFSESRRNNKKGTNQHTKKTGHVTYHMENENENENSNIINSLKEKNEIIKNEIISGGIFVEEMMRAHKVLITEDLFHEYFNIFWIEQYSSLILDDTNKQMNDIKKHFSNTIKKNSTNLNAKTYVEQLSKI